MQMLTCLHRYFKTMQSVSKQTHFIDATRFREKHELRFSSFKSSFKLMKILKLKVKGCQSENFCFINLRRIQEGLSQILILSFTFDVSVFSNSIKKKERNTIIHADRVCQFTVNGVKKSSLRKNEELTTRKLSIYRTNRKPECQTSQHFKTILK